MTDTPRKRFNAPKDPPRGDGKGDEQPEPKDWREPGGDVKEPAPPGTAGTEEKFPRKGDI